MKRIILIIALALPLISLSQVNKSILDTSKTWYNGISVYLQTYTNVLDIKGDTLIDNILYSKVFLSRYYGIRSHLDNSSLVFLAREDSNRVFVRNNFYENPFPDEFIVYDFNLDKGDTINIPLIEGGSFLGAFIKITIDSVDNIERGGTNLKRMFLSSDAGDFIPCQWIEGIGSTLGLFQVIGNISDGPYLFLNCLYQGDSLIYHYGLYPDCLVFVGLEDVNNDISVKLYPTIVDDVLNISSTDYPLNISFIDMFGREVLKETLYYDKTINCNALKSGYYTCKLTSKNNKTLIEKIIKR